jgi:hypothetical protein
MVVPGAGRDDGNPPGVVTVGLFPAAEPVFMPVVLLVPLPVAPVAVEVPVLLAPELPALLAAPGAAAPPVPPPAAPPACARAIEELIAKAEAKTIVVSFMGVSFLAKKQPRSSADVPSIAGDFVRTIPGCWRYQAGNEVNTMQRIYLGIAFLSVAGLVFASLLAIDKMLGG